VPTLRDSRAFTVKRLPQLFEKMARYDLVDAGGTALGSATQVGRDNWETTLHPKADEATAAAALRIGSDPRTAWSLKRFEVRSDTDAPVFDLIRVQATKSSMVVCLPQGPEVGRIRRLNIFGRARFALETDGETLAVMTAAYRRRNYAIVDRAGAAIASVVMTAGSVADRVEGKEYAVKVVRELHDPLRSLVAVAAVASDQLLYG
jgi:hypothetical protein